jgi:C_GCAxxG_C_C family probable redox protein
MPTPAETAVSVFGQSFNCAQSVFSAFAAQYGLPEKTALRLASPFGGGMARRGEVCGAVSGGLLVLGLARGAETPAGKDEIYRLSQEFMRRFAAGRGSIICRELLGCDISTPEGWLEAKRTGKTTNLCPLLVREAAEIVQVLLEVEV